MYLGAWQIDALLTFPANTHAATGAATDADAVPAYRVYEDETGTAILTGNMAKLDDANTTGFYSEQLTLSAANGFEVGKSYTVYIQAAVGGVTGTLSHTFQVAAAPAVAGGAMTLTATGLDAILIESGIAAGAGLVNDTGTQLTSINGRQALAVILASLAGVLSGAAGTNQTFKQAGKPAGNTRIDATTDVGDRTAITLKVPD
jgi:hypothetical protein